MRSSARVFLQPLPHLKFPKERSEANHTLSSRRCRKAQQRPEQLFKYLPFCNVTPVSLYAHCSHTLQLMPALHAISHLPPLKLFETRADAEYHTSAQQRSIRAIMFPAKLGSCLKAYSLVHQNTLNKRMHSLNGNTTKPHLRLFTRQSGLQGRLVLPLADLTPPPSSAPPNLPTYSRDIILGYRQQTQLDHTYH